MHPTRFTAHFLVIAQTALLLLGSSVGQAQETTNVFATHKDQVLQVRMVDRATDSKAGIGSGFRVSTEGHIITNFHVIAELIYSPEQYYAEYLLEDGSEGALTLRAIDVIHDLALMKTEDDTPQYLELETVEPLKGERLYAFGNPHDLGLTIVEGTYNGLLEKSIYDKIHFTASINPGMSGGPAINSAGLVVGVNVATAGNQLSFLVPAKYVVALLDKEAGAADTEVDFTISARDQLLDNQASYGSRLLEAPLKQDEMNNYVVPGHVAPFLSCWGDTQQDEDTLYEWTIKTCATSDDLYLSENQSSGAISFTHQLFSTKELGPIRFFGILQQHFQAHRPRVKAEETMVTNYDCETGFVEHNRIQSKVVFCLRAYKKFEGLFDAFMKATALTRTDESLQSTLTLAGVSYENAIQLSRAFLDSIEWKD